MKRTLLTVVIIAFTALHNIAQKQTDKVDIQWSDDLKEKKSNTLADIIGYDETGFYVLKRGKPSFNRANQQFFIEHFTNDLKQTKSVELDLEYKGKNRFYEHTIQVKGELYVVSSFRNKKLKKNFLFLQSLNKSTLRLNNDVKKIAEIDFKGNWAMNSGNFFVKLSRDSTKVMVFYNTPYEKYEKDSFGFHVFDDNLDLIWEKHVTLPYKEDLFDVERFKVDNNGNVFLLGVIFKDKRKEKRKGKPNYKYQILAYTDSGNTLIEYPVSIPGKFLADMQIAINKNNDIVCGGFYSDEGTFSIKGCYYLSIDAETKEIGTKEFKEFGIDFITQNMTEGKEKRTKKKTEKGKDVELYKYDLDEIILRTDGGAVLVGEQYFVEVITTTTTDANGRTSTSTTYKYNFNDIIVININPDGTIEWAEKIAKKQRTTNDGGFFSSYSSVIVDDKLFFVFNDNPKNMFYKGSGKIANFNKSKESIAVLVEVNKEGIQEREAIFKAAYKDILLRPMVCEQTGRKEVIIFGQRKKNQKFARLTFK